MPYSLVERLKHERLRVEDVKFTVRDSGENPMSHRLQYRNNGRALGIRLTKDSPRKMISWEYTYWSCTSNVNRSLATKAARKNAAVDHSNKDENVYLGIRKGLGLNQ